MKKRWIEKAVLLLSLAGALFLFAFFLKDILIPLFTLQLKNDVEGAKALLTSKGIAGADPVRSRRMSRREQHHYPCENIPL